MQNRIKIIFYTLSFFFILFSCDDKSKKLVSNSSFLPNASGDINEMLIVMDSTKFKGKIGRELVDIYSSYISGLPQPEPRYDLRYIKPRRFNSILKHAKNIVIAFTLEGNSIDSGILRKNFNSESINKIENDSSLFYFIKRDQYAKGQVILYLFGRNDNELFNKISKNRNSILKFFDDELKKRVDSEIFRKVENNLMDKIFKDHNLKIKIPFGYDIAKNIKEKNSNFFWLRKLDLEYDKNIFLYYEDYFDSELKNFYDVFNSSEINIKPIRNYISKKYLRDSEKSKIFMDIQNVFPIQSQKINYKGNLAVESKGLWKLSDISAGGPFHSKIIYDSEQNRIYYIEGYVYAPGLKKRGLMQEISSILMTFEL
tara:strand:- start:7344 stop:8453 length:1110 start_codon:yes stop_codon:yes gene_type:complete